ncbi:MAG: HD domain-containing protein [Candidatus Omnitrophica bacterium]|jgi:HD-GYP domain-containing protein (c-di-GMP phosphodiesterase class II)|nr:HD domain-containing protein [Candidatus Omnitrophota bacterium]
MRSLATQNFTFPVVIKKLQDKNKAIFIHGERVANFTCLISEEIGLSYEEITIISYAAILHDIGKTQVPAKIVNKPGALDKKESAFMRKHPELGCRLLKKAKLDPVVCRIVLEHHERVNGSGYPFGLQDKDIIYGAKIVAVADVINTMISMQPYRPALSMNDALKEIKGNSGILYDSKIAKAVFR